MHKEKYIKQKIYDSKIMVNTILNTIHYYGFETNDKFDSEIMDIALELFSDAKILLDRINKFEKEN